jgi:hypothetical protein
LELSRFFLFFLKKTKTAGRYASPPRFTCLLKYAN